MTRMTALLFRSARVVDGVEDEPIDGVDVLVVDGRIVEVGPGLGGPTAIDLRVVDLRGRTLMPGLIDAHVHPSAAEVVETFQRPMPTSLRALHARRRLEAMLQRGFTTVRDAGGADAGLRSATEQGLIDGPRLLVAGKALSQTGGHGDDRVVTDDDPPPGAYPGEFARIADGVEGVRLAAREELRRGADHIKICASGGVMSATDPVDMTQYTEEEMRAIVAEAASRRTYVLAHAYGADAIARAVRSGVRSIEHGNLVDAEAAAEVVAHGAWVVPTMVAYEGLARHGRAAGVDAARLAKNDEVRAAGLAAFGILRAAGARVGFGTDLLGSLDEMQPLEFEIRAEVETAADIVRSATSVNADLLGRADLGRIQVGATADLIVVDGDPLMDVRVLARPDQALRMVVTAGRIRVDRAG
jgi:imidazolonepropionase-like amidohydrolase